MTAKILFVDDDLNLLTAMRRSLRKHFNLVTAKSGADGLAVLDKDGPFSVVVSDMRMPGMDGVAFLQEAESRHPEVVRIMLTGNSDQETAMSAINQGRVFRFATKPCNSKVLSQIISQAQRQYELITAEKTLLEQTLAGSVKVLTDVLALSKPELFGQAVVMKAWAEELGTALNAPRLWEVGLAAMLSAIGRESIPAGIQRKIAKGAELTPEECELADRAPEFARDIITNIPRLGNVAEMVYLQDKAFDGTGFPHADKRSGTGLPIGARILFAVKQLITITKGFEPTGQDLDILKDSGHAIDPAIMKIFEQRPDAFRGIVRQAGEEITKRVKASWLRIGDLLEDDLKTTDGRLVLKAGSEVTETQVTRLKSFAKKYTFIEPVLVRRRAA